MRILMATSEAVPFAKTGGLADVTSALSIELAKLGAEVSLIMPAYRQVRSAGEPLEPTGVDLEIPIGAKTVRGRILRSRIPTSSVPIYFVECDPYYDRPELYSEKGQDYRDNCERFIFFSRAVLEAIRQLELSVDVIHCNDWQTGLIPAFVKIEGPAVPRMANVATLMTIHNMAYQGTFWHWDMLLTGLDWKYFNWQQMEYFGNLNLLKTGLVFADRISTVSPRYSQEIQSPLCGCGLEGVLYQRRDVLSGILNGIDTSIWNPADDPNLVAKYQAPNWQGGKAACKTALQRAVGLPTSPAPVVAFIGRLVEQKGIDLIVKGLREWLLRRDVQWVFLGTGDPIYHEALASLAQKFPDRLAVKLEFSDSLAHQIEAGADMYLMPSRFEPCGLNQMYSLKYGTPPIVRRTGGLADTIVDASPENLARMAANGFAFDEYSLAALGDAIDRALAAFAQREIWNQIVTTGMQQDWSWAESARQYMGLYEQTVALARRSQGPR